MIHLLCSQPWRQIFFGGWQDFPVDTAGRRRRRIRPASISEFRNRRISLFPLAAWRRHPLSIASISLLDTPRSPLFSLFNLLSPQTSSFQFLIFCQLLSQNISSRRPTFKSCGAEGTPRAHERHCTLSTEHFYAYWSNDVVSNARQQLISLLVSHRPLVYFHKTLIQCADDREKPCIIYYALKIGTSVISLTVLWQNGTAVAQWLRCYATNRRKVAGSIPASVIGFFIDIKFFHSPYAPGVY